MRGKIGRHPVAQHGKALGSGNQGQSTVEYLVVTFVLVAALVTAPGIYDTLSRTMTNKYHSYAFGVAVSDPPRKAFDDTVKRDADKVTHFFETLEKIEDLIGNSIFPDLKQGKLPDWKDVQKFGDLIKSLF